MLVAGRRRRGRRERLWARSQTKTQLFRGTEEPAFLGLCLWEDVNEPVLLGWEAVPINSPLENVESWRDGEADS